MGLLLNVSSHRGVARKGERARRRLVAAARASPRPDHGTRVGRDRTQP